MVNAGGASSAVTIPPDMDHKPIKAGPARGDGQAKSRFSVPNAEVEHAKEPAEDPAAHPHTPPPHTMMQCLGAALLYAATGIGITFVNKITLSYFKFPSAAFVAFCQVLCTIAVTWTLKALNYVQFDDVSVAACRKIMPMPVFFLGNAVSSLGGTKLVSIPTFTALRKFSMLFTMILERAVLGRSTSAPIQFSVFLMIAGAFVASAQDLNFNAYGYVYVMANNFFTAGNFIVTKQKADLASYGSVGSLFYCALLSLPFSFLFALPELHKVIVYHNWDNWAFMASFVLSTIMGCMVTFATILCTKLNSGLTTSVVGCLRNVIPVYVGMLSVFEYTFDPVNFAGHTVSVLGAIIYSVLKLRE